VPHGRVIEQGDWAFNHQAPTCFSCRILTEIAGVVAFFNQCHFPSFHGDCHPAMTCLVMAPGTCTRAISEADHLHVGTQYFFMAETKTSRSFRTNRIQLKPLFTLLALNSSDGKQQWIWSQGLLDAVHSTRTSAWISPDCIGTRAICGGVRPSSQVSSHFSQSDSFNPSVYHTSLQRASADTFYPPCTNRSESGPNICHICQGWLNSASWEFHDLTRRLMKVWLRCVGSLGVCLHRSKFYC
jgi:hypothetical protein